MERLISPRAVLAPILLSARFSPGTAAFYEDALVVTVSSLVVLSALCVVAFPLGLLFGNPAPKGNHWLISTAFAASLPATIVQSFIFLANGAAVSAGMILGGGGRNGLTGGAVVTLLVLVAVPLTLLLAVEKWLLPSADRTVVVARSQKERDEDDEDGFERIDRSTSGVELRCAGVRPLVEAKMLGPIIGDLRIQTVPSPLFPFAVPIALLIVSAAVGASGYCELLPLIVGLVYFAYAILVGVWRPFLGISHNTVEAASAAAAAVLLVCLFAVFEPEGSMASDAEAAFLLMTAAVSNCRYPFILARLLGVVSPPVVMMDWDTPSAAGADGDDEEDHEEEAGVMTAAHLLDGDDAEYAAYDAYDGSYGQGEEVPQYEGDSGYTHEYAPGEREGGRYTYHEAPETDAYGVNFGDL